MKARIIFGKTYRSSDQIESWCNSRGLQSIYIQPYSDDLEYIVDYFGDLGKRYNLSDITGAIVVVEDGDYAHIWVTWDSRPYLLDTDYLKVRLYLY
jgi:hypothetical protein